MKAGIDIRYKRAQTTDELQQILKLQEINLPKKSAKKDLTSEGFVTVEHDLETLINMNEVCPHFIAVSDKKVIGYALSMHPTFKHKIEILRPMFIKIESIVPKNLKYMVMGQICIEKNFRKKGIFSGLYHSMANELRNEFDAIITEVDGKNTRSLNAHLAAGFLILKRYRADNHNWNIMMLDIKKAR